MRDLGSGTWIAKQERFASEQPCGSEASSVVEKRRLLSGGGRKIPYGKTNGSRTIGERGGKRDDSDALEDIHRREYNIYDE